jgi:Xaa-Pro aminopeptidase
MRYEPIPSSLFIANRERLAKVLPPNSLAVLNANDISPANGDGSLGMMPNSDLFYLSGVEQEQTMLLFYPDADEEEHREILFIRQPTAELELWEGHKLTKDEARAISGIKRVRWLGDFPRLFHRLMCECDHVFLNSNEHKRAVVEVQSRDARFVAETKAKYPLHDYRRLAPFLHRLRAVKNETELALIRQACGITGPDSSECLSSLALVCSKRKSRRSSPTSSFAKGADLPISLSSRPAPTPVICITSAIAIIARTDSFCCWTSGPPTPITTQT